MADPTDEADGRTLAARIGPLVDDPCLVRLAEAVAREAEVSLRGVQGSSTCVLVAALAARRPGNLLVLVTAHLEDADEAFAELQSFGVDALSFPALEALPGESGPAADLVAARLAVVRRLSGDARPQAIVAPIAALMQLVPGPARLGELCRRLKPGERLDLGEFAAWLSAGGYARTSTIESPGEFAVRGGILDLFPTGGEGPVRLDLFGDEIERIFEIDLATQASDRAIPEIEIVRGDANGPAGGELVPLASLFPHDATVTVLNELAETLEQARGYFERVHDPHGIEGPNETLRRLAAASRCLVQASQHSPDSGGVTIDLPLSSLPPFADEVRSALIEIAALGRGHDVTIVCDTEGEASRTRELLAEHAPGARATVVLGHLHRGFLWRGEGFRPPGPAIALIPQGEILHRYGFRRRGRRLAGGKAREAFVSFEPGDFVVHRDHGIARFVGLQRLARKEGDAAAEPPEEEFLTLEFDGGSRLHVPASRIELVQKYIGAGGTRPPLSLLGGKRWKRAKEEVEEGVKELAAELLRVQAAREAVPGIRYPADTAWQAEFEAEFPYEETEDQKAAIAAAKRDMTSPRPMDRLICGDVGFGKTEVAIRAAFKAVEHGKQVAVLVPTTVLAEQHERTFRDRFRAYPFRVESLSRFKTDAEARGILAELAAGKVDVVIGTHRLLSPDVRFRDLGLVVVDEEQRFGVEHKNRLLGIRTIADVLTLSATPIPRTLHMAMLGLRDISSLTTAPLDRRAIVTEVIPPSPQRVGAAIRRELAREGQVFYVHNRVHGLEDTVREVQDLAPGARIVMGHGQMAAKELEEVMLRFMRHDADILVSTTIIESGIDIPTANTMVIRDAHRFGLAELHQLRGRVGRWKHRAYCYLLLPEDRTITEDSMRRLKAIEDYSMLGAGFKIAMRDLEIRGAGNLLGAEQSGHIAAVGYEMYCELLEQAVAELKSEPKVVPADITIDIGLAGSVPKGYIPSDARRMEAYRRIGQAQSLEALAKVTADLASAYGEPPAATRSLIEFAEIRLHAAALGIAAIQRREGDVVFRTARSRDLETRLRGVQGTVRAVGGVGDDGLSEIRWRPPPAFLAPASLTAVLRKRLGG
jgi:transcription-repair coupling factor (superfamily II helicase)